MAVVCVIWGTLFQFPTGPRNQIVGALTRPRRPDRLETGNPASAMPAIVLLSAWQAYGFQMVVYLAGLQSIPGDLYEAARLDGASILATLPLRHRPGLRQTNIFVIIITTIRAFKTLHPCQPISWPRAGRATTETVVQYMYQVGFGRSSASPRPSPSSLFIVLGSRSCSASGDP